MIESTLEENSTQKSDNTKKLEEIASEISICQKCDLSKTRTQAVPGQGNPSAEILFVGEAPGQTEDEKGIPFCGQAGKFLDQMLEEIDLSRSDVFIANTLKCRPPENRDPEDSEKIACRPFLEAQIKAINPLLIVCLGRHATTSLLPASGGISRLHGQAVRRPNGQVYLPLYHPAAALHNGGLRQTLIDDFKKIPAILNKIKSNQKQKKQDKNQTNQNNNNINQQKLI